MGFEVLVGGGLGRAPMIGHVIREFLPKRDLLAYLEAILRVYNLEGRRDNIHKARIKILVKAIGPEKFRELVEEEFVAAKDTAPVFDAADFERIKAFFAPKAYESLQDQDVVSGKPQEFRNWFQYNTRKHKVAGYRAVFLSLKSPKRPPGDITANRVGSRGRSGRTVFARRDSLDARSEPVVRPREAERSVRAVAAAEAARSGDREHRHAHRHDLLPGWRFLRACECDVRFRWPRRSTSVSTASITSTIWARSS